MCSNPNKTFAMKIISSILPAAALAATLAAVAVLPSSPAAASAVLVFTGLLSLLAADYGRPPAPFGVTPRGADILAFEPERPLRRAA